jgi:hypothetical protein
VRRAAASVVHRFAESGMDHGFAVAQPLLGAARHYGR